jgi:hypothetical protein
MQVSVRWPKGPIEDFDNEIALVAFEFGVVRDPHEFLQDEARTRVWTITRDNSPQVVRDMQTALMDKHRGLLGRRGNLWISPVDLFILRNLFVGVATPPPWESKQVMDPATLLWTAKRVPEVHYRVPAISGITAGNALHEAVQQAVLLQGAFRALSLNKDFRTKSR